MNISQWEGDKKNNSRGGKSAGKTPPGENRVGRRGSSQRGARRRLVGQRRMLAAPATKCFKHREQITGVMEQGGRR